MNRVALSRRLLLQAAAVAPMVAALPVRAALAPAKGLKIGLASYSLRKKTLDEVVAFCQANRVRYLTLKEMHLPFDSTPAQIAEARTKLADAGIELAGVGVVYMKKEDEVKRAFDYAKEAHAPLIVGAPNPELLDAVEKAAKEYDLPVAIHNHGPEDKLYPSPRDVLTAIKARDKRLGVCMDVGHTVRSGLDPVKCVAECGARLFDLHVKDLKDKADKNSRVEIGAGVIDNVALLRALAKRRFGGHVALEYELDAEDPAGGIRASLGYLRGVAAAIGA